MSDIIDEYEEAEVIQPEKVQELLGRVMAKSATLKMTEYGCELSPDKEGYAVHFVRAGDGNEVQLEPDKGWLTVSYCFITFDGKKYQVETDGPFHLEITGLPEAIEEAKE